MQRLFFLSVLITGTVCKLHTEWHALSKLDRMWLQPINVSIHPSILIYTDHTSISVRLRQNNEDKEMIEIPLINNSE